MVVVATVALFDEDDDDGVLDSCAIRFWGQNREICPFWSHRKHFPSLIRFDFSSSVIVAQALARPTSTAFGSRRRVRALVHCSRVPPITLFPLCLLLS